MVWEDSACGVWTLRKVTERPLQWKVTGASDARGNRKGGREERPKQWKVTDASDARGNRKGGREERPTVESYRCLRRAWELKRRKGGSGRYNGKLPVIQTRGGG